MASRVLAHQLLQVGLPRVVVAVVVAAAAGGPLAAEARGQETVTICHVAGAEYVPLTVTLEGTEAHVDHEGDIIPAPAEGCPEFVNPDDLPRVTPTPTVTPTQTVTPTPTVTPAPPPADPDGAAPERDRDPGTDARGRDGDDQAPGTGGQGAGPGANPSPAAPTPGDAGAEAAPPAGAPGDAVGPAGQEPPGGRTATGLPVTGSEPGLVALFAAGFLLTGLGLRLLVGPPPVRPAG